MEILCALHNTNIRQNIQLSKNNYIKTSSWRGKCCLKKIQTTGSLFHLVFSWPSFQINKTICSEPIAYRNSTKQWKIFPERKCLCWMLRTLLTCGCHETAGVICCFHVLATGALCYSCPDCKVNLYKYDVTPWLTAANRKHSQVYTCPSPLMDGLLCYCYWSSTPPSVNSVFLNKILSCYILVIWKVENSGEDLKRLKT